MSPFITVVTVSPFIAVVTVSPFIAVVSVPPKGGVACTVVGSVLLQVTVGVLITPLQLVSPKITSKLARLAS